MDDFYALKDILFDGGERLKSFVFNLPHVTCKKDIPHQAGVYFLVDGENNFLYIGKSKNIYKRWVGRKDFLITKDRKLYLLSGIDFATKFNIEEIEAIFILLLTPRFNRGIRCKIISR